MLALSRSICIPPRCNSSCRGYPASANMDGKFQVQPSHVFLRDNPNMYTANPLYMTCPQRKSKFSEKIRQIHPPQRDKLKWTTLSPWTPPLHLVRGMKKWPQQHCMRILFFITNLSSTSRVVLPKDHIMAFITPENLETNYIEIAEVQSVEEQCRNWKCPMKVAPKSPWEWLLGISWVMLKK